jgi:hypothetical protein
MEFIVSMNQYCLAFNESFYDAALSIPSVVGLSPFYRGWNAVYHRLSKFAQGMSVDVKSYDSHMCALLLRSIRDIRINLSTNFTHEDYERFAVLYDEIINTLMILPSGEILQKFAGNPSGSPNTIVDNTICLWIVVYFSLFYYGNFTIDLIEKLFVFVFGGDDNTFTLSDTVSSKHVGWCLEQGFGLFGWTLKGVLAEPLQKLHFFSNSFHLYRGFRVPVPIEPEKLMTSLACKYKNTGAAETLQRACAIRILCRYDYSYYSLLTDFILYMIGEYDRLLLNDLDWKTAKKLFFSDSQIDDIYLGGQEN